MLTRDCHRCEEPLSREEYAAGDGWCPACREALRLDVEAHRWDGKRRETREETVTR